MTTHQDDCFHCGLPVPLDTDWTYKVLGETRRFCCPGCREVCRTIADAGMEDYYRHRAGPAARADPESLPEILQKLALYDHPDVQRSFVKQGTGWREAALILEDIRCSACLWLNEQHLRALDGVLDVEMDYASQRAYVRWDPEKTQLSHILRAIADIGYVAYPYDTRHREQLLRDRKRRSGQRIIFAGAIAMPVMQFSLSTYLMGGPQPDGSLLLWEVIGRWFFLLAVTAVLAYSGQEFYVAAWRDLKNRRLGMDVPVVLGLSIAWLGSLWATVTRQGDVYLDSIAMFVLFVLLARVFEMRGRVSAADAMDRLARVVPQTVHRLRPDGDEEEVPAVEVKPGERLRVRPGEFLAVDGVIRAGRSSFDESRLTGEGLPVTRGEGDTVLAGTCNRDQPVEVEVVRMGEDSSIGDMQRLLEHGLRSRPASAELANRVAGWFVAGVLAIAVAVAAIWGWVDSERALPVTIAVLIVTCPCALALATPVALAVSMGRFAGMGFLPLDMAAVERLAGADVVALDKTGTLTTGEFVLETLHVVDPGLSRERILALAAALERDSEHPLAGAFHGPGGLADGELTERIHVPGSGVEARLGRTRWRIGRPDWALEGHSLAPEEAARVSSSSREGRQVVALARDGDLQALFVLQDAIRPAAERLDRELKALGVRRVAILSGDRTQSVRAMAGFTGIDEFLGDCSPADKLVWIQERQVEGHRVMMVGDGINDAPTLAAADVSLSFGEATELAQLHSHFIVLSRSLEAIPRARRLARLTRRNIRQNLAWAVLYNALAVPAAALGLVPPWGAAIGMSVSSLAVVANALRLRRGGAGPPNRPESGFSVSADAVPSL